MRKLSLQGLHDELSCQAEEIGGMIQTIEQSIAVAQAPGSVFRDLKNQDPCLIG